MTETIHQAQPVETAGAPLDSADAAVLMLHGRGATPGSVLALAREFDAPGVAYLVPAAANRTWYPDPFTAPIESNQPHLDSALATVEKRLAEIEDAEIPTGVDRPAWVLPGRLSGRGVRSPESPAVRRGRRAFRRPDRPGGLGRRVRR